MDGARGVQGGGREGRREFFEGYRERRSRELRGRRVMKRRGSIRRKRKKRRQDEIEMCKIEHGRKESGES